MKRQAFGMIFAIIIIIIIATLGILGLKLSSRTLNTTTNQHVEIQLNLYLDSTIDLATLYIQRNGFEYQEGSTTNKRANIMAPITKNINYGPNNEYKFTYTMTPLYNPDRDTDATKQQKNNIMLVDVSGYVVNPITNQIFRVTKRQIIRP